MLPRTAEQNAPRREENPVQKTPDVGFRDDSFGGRDDLKISVGQIFKQMTLADVEVLVMNCQAFAADGKVKYVCFVAETKGGMSSLGLRKLEAIKIECAEKFFEVLGKHENKLRYHQVDGYGTLLGLVEVEG